MGLIAFDLDTNEPIFASNAVKKEKGRYVCPFPACRERRVPVHITERQTGIIFVTYPNVQHDENCDFPTAYEAAYHNAIIENFSLEDIYNNAISEILKHESNNKAPRQNEKTDKAPKKEININTLYDLYRFCSSNEPTYSVGDHTIQDFYIALSTTELWYSKRKEVNNVLVLAVGYTCQIMWKEHRIRLMIDKDRPFKISISFDDLKYFDTVTSKIKKYNSPEVKLFVCGYASSKNYTFTNKSEETVTYSEITVNAIENSIHFLSRKKNVL